MSKFPDLCQQFTEYNKALREWRDKAVAYPPWFASAFATYLGCPETYTEIDGAALPYVGIYRRVGTYDESPKFELVDHRHKMATPNEDGSWAPESSRPIQ